MSYLDPEKIWRSTSNCPPGQTAPIPEVSALDRQILDWIPAALTNVEITLRQVALENLDVICSIKGTWIEDVFLAHRSAHLIYRLISTLFCPLDEFIDDRRKVAGAILQKC